MDSWTFWIITCAIAVAVLWWINKNYFNFVFAVVYITFDQTKINACTGIEVDAVPYFYLMTMDEFLNSGPDWGDPFTPEHYERMLADFQMAAQHGMSQLNMEARKYLVNMYFESDLPAAVEPITRFAHTYLRRNLLQAAANERTLTYQSMAVFFTIVLLLCLVLQTVSHLRSLSTSQDIEKRSEYECGFAPFDSATRLPFDVHFYLVGILFLVFDVEVSLMFPWAVGLLSVGWFGIFAMLIFVFVLTVGFVYEWQRGALIWPAHYSILQTSLANYKWSLPLLFVLVCPTGIVDLLVSLDSTVASMFFVATPLLASAPTKRTLADQKRKQRAEREVVRKQNQQARAVIFAQLAKEAAIAAEAAKPTEEQIAKAKEEAARLAAEEAAKKAAAPKKEGESAAAPAVAEKPAAPRESILPKIIHKLRNPIHRLLGRNLTSFWPLTYLRTGEYGAPDLKWSLVNAEVDRKSRQKYDVNRLHPNQLLPLAPIVFVYAVSIAIVLALFCVAVDFAIGDMRDQLVDLWNLWYSTRDTVHDFFVQNFDAVPAQGGWIEGVLTFLLLLPASMYNVWVAYTREFITVVVIWTYFFWYFTASLLDRRVSHYLVWRRQQLALREREEEAARQKRRALGAIHPDKGRKDVNLGLLLLITDAAAAQMSLSTVTTLIEILVIGLSAFALLDYFARFASKSAGVAQNGHPVFLVIGLFTVLLVFFTPHADYADSFWKGTAGLVAVAMYLYAACIYAARTFRLELWKGLYTRSFAFMLLAGGAFLFFATVYSLSEVHNLPMTKIAYARPYTLQFGLPVAIVCLVTAIWYEYQYSAFRGRLITPGVWYGRKYLYRYSNLVHERRFAFQDELSHELSTIIRARVPASRARRLAKRLIPISESVIHRAKTNAAIRAAVVARAKAAEAAKAAKAARAEEALKAAKAALAASTRNTPSKSVQNSISIIQLTLCLWNQAVLLIN